MKEFKLLPYDKITFLQPWMRVIFLIDSGQPNRNGYRGWGKPKIFLLRSFHFRERFFLLIWVGIAKSLILNWKQRIFQREPVLIPLKETPLRYASTSRRFLTANSAKLAILDEEWRIRQENHSASVFLKTRPSQKKKKKKVNIRKINHFPFVYVLHLPLIMKSKAEVKRSKFFAEW